MSIFDLMASPYIAAYYNEMAYNRQPFLGDELFPAKKQYDLELKYLKGRNNVPCVLKASAWDVQVIPRDRGEIATLVAEIPYFKESYRVDEKLRRELLRLNNSSADIILRDELLTRIFNDIGKLVESAAVTRERMRMQLITTGNVTFTGNGQIFEYDYQFEDEQFVDGVNWSDPTVDLTPDIIAIREYYTQLGLTMDRAIMNRTTFTWLLNNENIRATLFWGALAGNPNATLTMTDAQIRQYFMQTFELEIVVYDKAFQDEFRVTQKYIPDGIVVFTPATTLGSTVFSYTPQEIDAGYLNEKLAVKVTVVDTGVSIMTTIKEDPVQTETIVAQVVAPSCEQADNIVIMDVNAA